MNDCLFCKIIAGEIPSAKVYEDEKTFAFLDINPVNPGHTLVVPKAHAKNIFEIEPNDWAKVCETVRMLAGKIETAMDASGINLEMNNRQIAGQLVDHTHVHIIPRHSGDGLVHWPHHQYKDGEIDTAREKIIAQL